MLESLQQEQVISTNNDKFISLYEKGKVSPETFAKGIKLLQVAFPKLRNDWFKLLETLIDVEGFSDKRFMDAIYNLIKNYKYPEPLFSDILGFDKKIELYTYDELLEKCNDFSVQMRREFLNRYEMKDKERKLYGLKDEYL